MAVLITGATGFAGQHLANYLAEQNDSKLFGTSFSNNHDKREPFTELFPMDLRVEDQVRKLISELKPSVIYHLAAQSSPKLSYDDPWPTLETNIRGTLNILEAVRDLDDAQNVRIINVSSAAIYQVNSLEDLPLTEQSSVGAGSPYEVSKIAQDLLGTQYAAAHQLDVIGARPFNHTGAGHAAHFVFTNFAKQIAEAEAGKQEPIIEVGNLDAERDYLDVRDVVRAYALLAEHGIKGNVYNICSGHSHSIEYFLYRLIDLADIKMQVKVDDKRFRPIDLPRLVGDNSALRQATGWKPYYSIDNMLASVLEHARAQV